MTTKRSVETWHQFPGLGISLDHQTSPFMWRVFTRGAFELEGDRHHFGFVVDEVATLECRSGEFQLGQCMYFSVPGKASLRALGQVMVLSREQYSSVFMIGGPTEAKGRLRYIDGCSDSLLIPPVVKGDPCLNLLCIPPTVDQTPHTHPSFRVGTIIEGSCICRTIDMAYSLERGMYFVIHQDCLHSFHTADQGARIVAFHPDSDFGPTDDDHPMLNRTVVGGERVTHTQEPERIPNQ